MAVTSSFQITTSFTDDGDATSTSTLYGGGLTATLEKILSMTDGTTANKADVAAAVDYSITASGTQLVVLNDAISSEISGTLTIAEVVALVFLNTSSTAGDAVTIESDSTNGNATIFGATGDLVRLDPGGVVAFFSPIDGYALTNSTDEILLTETGGANTVTVRMMVIGRSA